MVQLDKQLAWSNENGCVETDVDLFIHVTDTQRHVKTQKFLTYFCRKK